MAGGADEREHGPRAGQRPRWLVRWGHSPATPRAKRRGNAVGVADRGVQPRLFMRATAPATPGACVVHEKGRGGCPGAERRGVALLFKP
jgi:hypothetical protein